MNKRIDINGVIGEDFWNPEASNTVKTVIQQIGDAAPGDTLEVHVNSGGGSFFEGLAIYNTLRQYAARGFVVETWVDGLAASAASIIMLAGERRVMAKSAMVMIHNVWSWAMGDANDMEKAAKELRQFNAVAASTYAERTKEDQTSALALMDAETWMDGEDCQTRGFATEVGHGDTSGDAESDVAARAMAGNCVLMDNLKHVPKWLKFAASKDRRITPDMVTGSRREPFTKPAPSAQVKPFEGQPQAAQAAVPVKQEKIMEEDNIQSGETQIDVSAAVAQAVQAETTRSRTIRERITAQAAAGTITQEQERALIAAHVDTVSPVAVATEAILAAIEANAANDLDQQVHRAPARVTADGRDKFVEGATQAAMSMTGLVARDPRNEFNGLGLRGLAAMCLERAGKRAVGTNATIAKQILNMHSTSDFPMVLENIQTKSVLIGYETADEVFDKLARRGSLPDYKVAKRIGTSMFPSLAVVPEGAEYEEGTFGERNASISLAKFGRICTVTEEMIINDDLDALGRIANKMGVAAKRTVGNLFWAVFTDNPTFNGAALFSGGRQNLLTGGGSALSDAGLTAASTAFETRTDAQTAGGALTDAFVKVMPKYLITSVAQKHAAARIMTQEFIAGTGGAAGAVPNTHAGAYETVYDARLDRAVGGSTRWFLAADPNQADTIEISYLDGRDTPEVTRHDEHKRDAISFKVKLVAGVAPLDYVGLLRCDGV